nr:PD-(D/E)XK motif protein [Deinococcus aestuarii]
MHAFRVLASQPVEAGRVRTWQEDVRTRAGPAALALDEAGNRMLLVRLTRHQRVVEDRRSAAVTIERVVLVEDGTERPFVRVRCVRRHLDDVFALLTAEMLQALEEGVDQPDLACAGVLRRWRELLDRPTERGLTDAQVVGLYGELWYLRELVRHDSSALDAWHGPLMARHDFRRGLVAAEVKSTLSATSLQVEVHGFEQLQPPNGGQLYLVTVRLEVAEDGETLADLVEEVVTLGADASVLTALLAAVGAPPTELEQHRGKRFRVRETRCYSVIGDFPRLVPESFVTGRPPGGVVSVSYRIDLTHEPPVPASEDVARGVVQRLARGGDV